MNTIDAEIIYVCPTIDFHQFEDGISFYKADVFVKACGKTSAASITDKDFDTLKEKARVGNIIQIWEEHEYSCGKVCSCS